MEANNMIDLLLNELIADAEQDPRISISDQELPAAEMEKRNLIRSLMNVRMPRAATDKLLSLQDQYLQEETEAKGVVTLSDIPTIQEQYDRDLVQADYKVPFADKLSLWQGDITRLQAGAIVNAANSQMLGCFVPCHRCIDNAIHSAAGIRLREECSRIMQERRDRHGREYEEPTGTATLTKSYNLPSDYVIHTVGPIVYGSLSDAHRQDLRSCYDNILRCCVEHQIRSVAFCCISTGEFHFPNDEAARIAIDAVISFLEQQGDQIERVIFNVFADRDREIYEKLLHL